MDDSRLTAGAEGSVTPEKTHRLLSFLHRGGNVAIRGAETSVEDADVLDDNSDNVFGLEEDLYHYIELRDEHQQVIDEALDDTDTANLLQDILMAHEEATPMNFQKRRQIEKLANAGYPRFIAIFVACGRQTASMLKMGHSGQIYFGKDVKKAKAEADTERAGLERIISKKKGLFAAKNLNANLAAVNKLQGKFDEIEEASHRTAAPILKLEWKMGTHIMGQLENDSATAFELLDSFIDATQSDVAVERAFATLLANRLKEYGHRSELHKALDIAEYFAAHGGLAEEFINSELAEDNSTMAFFADSFSESREAFVEKMMSTYDEWPQEYKTTYLAQADAKIRNYRINIGGKFSERAVNPAWMRPDVVELEKDIDRLFGTIYQGYTDKGLQHQHKKTETTPVRTHVGTADITRSYKTPEQEGISREVVTVVRGASGYLTRNGTSVEELIADKLGNTHKDNKAFRTELQAAIARLRLEPFDHQGVRSVRNGNTSQKIMLDGKTVRVYEANPAHMSGLSTSRQSKELRVVFTADRNRLNILGIFTQHGEYVRFLRDL